MPASDGKLAGRRPTVPEVQAIIDLAVAEGQYDAINFLHVIVEDENYDPCFASPMDESALSHALAFIVSMLTRSQLGRLRYDSHEAFANSPRASRAETARYSAMSGLFFWLSGFCGGFAVRGMLVTVKKERRGR